jgi:hypothetical protein
MHNASWIAFPLVSLSIAVGMQATGCVVNSVEDCQEAGECATGGSGGSTTTNSGGSGGAGGSITPPGCIPSENPDPVEDDCGVFVSTTGDDNNLGTKSAPVATLTAALALAQQNMGRVYACSQEFPEAVAVPPDGKIYGGLDCTTDWKHIPGQKTTIAPATDMIPVTLEGGPGARLEDVTIKAADATMEGGSSIAVIAQDGASADLVRCDLTASQGAVGPAGTSHGMRAADGEPGNAPATPGCISALTVAGGVNKENAQCNESIGGEGGPGSVSQGGPGFPGQPDATTAGGGQTASMVCGAGDDGVDGPDGLPGAGALGIGTISASGYTGALGGQGMTTGMPGRGGGGGGGARGASVCANTSFAGHSGGSGASGGCGGTPGNGGGPGGSSIGLLSYNAAITLNAVIISTANGGDGGVGGLGQEGGYGGGVGGAPGGAGACAGGKGGNGGRGGPGGGGLGGHSIGIAFVGTPPVQIDVSIGQPGTPGAGGQGAVPTPESGGAGGVACKTLDFLEPASCQ